MIPVRPPRPNAQNENEPEAIRSLKKKALYKLLSERYLLPEENSKGVNRHYLVGVYTGRYFRVDVMDHKRFEVELTPGQQKKTPFLNTADSFVKLQKFLQELGQPPLGFDIGAFPKDTWLYKIIRYVDRENVTGVYLETVDLPYAANIVGAPGNVMMRSKRNAERFLLAQVINVSTVYQALKSLWDCHKKEISRRREVEQLTRELASSRERLNGESAAVNAALAKASMVVYSAGTGEPIDQIFVNNEQAGQRRAQMNDITDM